MLLALSIVVAAVSMFAISGCFKMTNGTGVLTVVVYDPNYDYEIAVYPYVSGVEDAPIATAVVEEGRKREVSFTLNSGDYVVYCGFDYQAVQVQEGDNITIYFSIK